MPLFTSEFDQNVFFYKWEKPKRGNIVIWQEKKNEVTYNSGIDCKLTNQM